MSPISSGKSRRFASVLRKTSARLTLPEPLKSRILLEMAADLEALAEHFRSQGASEEEASARAQERFLATPEAIDSLIRVHTTGAERIANRIAWYLRSGFDLTMFWLGLLPILAAAGYTVAVQLRAPDGGPFLWIILALGCLSVILGTRQAWGLVSRRRALSSVRRGLFDLLFLGVLTSLVGFLGFVHGVYAIAIAAGRASPDVTESLLMANVAALANSATVLTLALSIGVGAGLTYVVLVNRGAMIEQAESAALLGFHIEDSGAQ